MFADTRSLLYMDVALPHDRHLATILRAFSGIGAGSAEQMLANYTDDLVLELPYANPPVRLEGKSVILAYLTRAFGVFEMTLDVTSVFPTTDPDVVVVEYTSSGRALPTGRAYANSYVGIYWFRDDLVCHVREYYNPVVGAAALVP
jgi:ketosteroid isomerase-like protein